jgi:hypothetical protein
MLSKSIKLPLFAMLSFALLLNACAPGVATADPQQAADAIATAVELTVIARSTEMALQVPPTEVPPTATFTETSTPILPPTPIPTNTPFVLPTTSGGGTSGGSGGGGGGGGGSSQTDKLACAVVAQKPYDGQFIYKPGDSFDVKWTIKNTGTQTWEAGWAFQYLSDSNGRLSPTPNHTLGSDVKRGETITLLIEVTAPNTSGRDKETFVEQWTIIGDGVKFCRPYIAIFVQR